jgi:hypothetical protein
MGTVKKNWLSILFGVIAILACCTLIWPIPQKFATLRTDLTTRAATDGKLQQIIKQTHNMPVLSPDQSNPDQLGVFPADKVREAGVAAAAKVTDQASNMLNAVIKMNTHTLLVPNSFPDSDENMKYKFIQTYLPQVIGYARWQKTLNFGARALPPEIATRTAQLHDQIFASRIFFTRNAQGVAVPDPNSVDQAQNEFNSKSSLVEPEVQLEHAKNCSVYLEPGVLPTDPTINVNPLPEIGRMWDDQVGLWFCDDLIATIARINKQFADPEFPGGPPVYDVLHSPIKLISHVDRPYAIRGDTGNDPRIAQNVSLSGRTSNKLYDVLRFKVDLTIDAAKLPQILHAMEVGQFFTVLGVQVNGVQDPALAAQQGYRFGDKPTLLVELDCEMLYMKGWSDPYVPQTVKSAYGGSIAPQGGTGFIAGAPTDTGGGGDGGDSGDNSQNASP